jgi:hypothetical protein
MSLTTQERTELLGILVDDSLTVQESEAKLEKIWFQWNDDKQSEASDFLVQGFRGKNNGLPNRDRSDSDTLPKAQPL